MRKKLLFELMSMALLFNFTLPLGACGPHGAVDGDSSGFESSDDGQIEETPYEPVKLEGNGIEINDYNIVISEEASDAEKYAARVMQENIQKATQLSLDIVTDAAAETENEIIIGKTLRGEDDDIDFVSLGAESYVVKTVGNDLVIGANAERGVIYGVYAYLEALGYRYYTPECESIPRSKDVFIAKEVDLSWTPTFTYREAMAKSAWDPEWAVSQCINSDFMRSELRNNKKYGGFIGFSGGDQYLVHTAKYLLPDSVFSEHPDYFSQNADGTRTTIQVCFTSDGALDYMYQSAVSLLEKNNTGIISISQKDADGNDYCRCNNCLASYEKYGKMGTLLNFINEIADRLAPDYPDVLVETLSYSWGCELPKGGVMPRDNVIIRLCLPLCRQHTDPSDCDKLAEDVEILEGWSKLTDKLFVWLYPVNWANSFEMQGNFGTYWHQIQTLVKNNVVAVYPEITGIESPEFSEWRAYLFAKLCKNPTMSFSEYRYHMEDFAYGYYGDGGKYILEYVDYLEELGVGGHNNIMTYVPSKVENGETKYDLTFFEICNGWWDEAEENASPDVLPHIEKSRLHLTMTELLNTGTKRYKTANDAEREILVERNETLYKNMVKYGCMKKYPEHNFNANIKDFRLFPEKW